MGTPQPSTIPISTVSSPIPAHRQLPKTSSITSLPPPAVPQFPQPRCRRGPHPRGVFLSPNLGQAGGVGGMLSQGSVAVATRRAVSRRPPERRDAAELLPRHSKKDRGGGGCHGAAPRYHPLIQAGFLVKKKNVWRGQISTVSSPGGQAEHRQARSTPGWLAVGCCGRGALLFSGTPAGLWK